MLVLTFFSHFCKTGIWRNITISQECQWRPLTGCWTQLVHISDRKTLSCTRQSLQRSDCSSPCGKLNNTAYYQQGFKYVKIIQVYDFAFFLFLQISCNIGGKFRIAATLILSWLIYHLWNCEVHVLAAKLMPSLTPAKAPSTRSTYMCSSHQDQDDFTSVIRSMHVAIEVSAYGSTGDSQALLTSQFGQQVL